MTPDLRLIVITDAGAAAPRPVMDVVAEALDAGAPAIQLRDKTATARELFEQARELLPLTRRHGALLFINDRCDVALAAEADGVHVGPNDLPVEAVRAAARAAGRRLGTDAAVGSLGIGPNAKAARTRTPAPFFIGTSTDDPERARALVAEGADYIGCGAVFGTTSKEGLEGERIGPGGLARVAEAVDVPVVGIGGVTPDNVAEIADSGAAGAAAIQSVMDADDVGAAVRRLISHFGE